MSQAPVALPHGWSRDALLAKAQRFAEEMFSHDRDDWRFGFWSALTLEMLARAALANVSPVLLADARDWNNLYHALGFAPKTPRFVPRSLDITSVFTRLRDVLDSFDPALEGFGIAHMLKRNEELHSGDTSFEGTSSWLATYYQTCEVLLESMDEDLEMLFGSEEASVAEKLMEAAEDETAKAVGKAIHEHSALWNAKDKVERDNLSNQASTWAARRLGHRVKCPSCGSAALVAGEPMAAPVRSLKEDIITETQFYLPSRFECIACALKISGFAQLNAAGLGEPYKATSAYDAAEYYRPDDEYGQYEPDFNEQ